MRRIAKKYLVAHTDNDHRPYLLRPRGALVALLMIVGLFGVFALHAYVIRTNYFAAVISSVIVDLTNVDRTTRGLQPLTVNPILQKAAQLKANDMAAKGYFSHVSPDGISPWYWFGEAEYTFLYAGENLAVNFSESLDVENAWMESMGHRTNILHKNFTEIGVATAEGMFNGNPTTFVVQLFGKPMPKKVTALSQPKTAVAATQSHQASSTPEATTQQVQNVRVSQVKDMFIAVEQVDAAGFTEQTENSEMSNAINSETAGTTPVQYSNAFMRALLQPSRALAVTYGLMTAIIFFAITSILMGDFKRHHAKMVMYGFVLIMVMSALAVIFGSYVISAVNIV
jgi:hypothetical protein